MGTITMIETWKSKGVYFLFHIGYDYSSTVIMEVDCDDCILETKKKLMLHYVVILEGVTHYIPEYVAVILDPEMGEVIPPGTENAMAEYIDVMYTDAYQDENGKTDFVRAAKIELGVDIAAKDRADQADHAGAYLLKKIKERYPNEK